MAVNTIDKLQFLSKGICVNVIDPDLFFRFLNGHCHGQLIVGKICKMTFIQHAGVRKWIRISQFRFTGVTGQYFCYILCKFNSDRSTTSRDYAGSFCNFSDKMAKIDISYHISQQILDQSLHLSIGRRMCKNYKTSISFAVAQRSLLW